MRSMNAAGRPYSSLQTEQGRMHGNPGRGWLGRGSNEQGKGINALGWGSNDLGMLKYKLSYP